MPASGGAEHGEQQRREQAETVTTATQAAKVKKAPLQRHTASVLENSACATPWPPQCTSAGACQNGTDSTVPSTAPAASAGGHAGFGEQGVDLGLRRLALRHQRLQPRPGAVGDRVGQQQDGQRRTARRSRTA